MSALANLAGFFPPTGEQIWKSKINWQPIPVHTRPIEEDYRLALSLSGCDHYVYLLLQYLGKSNRLESFQQNRTLIKYLEMKSGQNISSPLDISILYDTLWIEQQQGKW